MRTKTSDFLNTDTMKPEYSFQFSDGGVWRWPTQPNREPMRWATTAERDRARAAFRSRKTPERAYADLGATR